MHVLFSAFQEKSVLHRPWMFILILTELIEDNFSTAQLSKLHNFLGVICLFPYMVNCLSVVLVA